MTFPNYFENQTHHVPITDNMPMNSTNSLPQYNESLDFISNRDTDLGNHVTYPPPAPPIENTKLMSETQLTSAKCATQFSCEKVGCNKPYASMSGLNNHIKK